MRTTANNQHDIETRYLFVNEDANTLFSKSNTATVNQSKQSHIQHLCFLKKREAAKASWEALHQSATAALPYRSLRASGPRTTNLCNPIVPHIAQSENYNLAEGEVDQEGVTGAAAQLLTRMRINIITASARRTSAPEIPRPPQGSVVDPFASTSLNVHLLAPSLVEYYTNAMMPAIFNTDARALSGSKQRYLRAFRQDMQECMSDEGHMYALLATTSAHRQKWGRLLLNTSSGDKTTCCAPIFFKMKAMTSLRRKLVNGQRNLASFQDIYRLMTTDTILGNAEEAYAHFQALKVLINAFGGLSKLDAYNKERIIHVELYNATQTMRCPDMPLTYDPGHLPAERERKLNLCLPLPHLGVCFLEPQLSTMFHTEMQSILSDLMTVVQITVYSWKHIDLSQEEVAWLALRRLAIDHRLLAFPSVDLSCNLFQECTRIAIIFWLSMTLRGPICKEILMRFNSHLRMSLERSGLQSLWFPNPKLLLWVVTMGAFMASDEKEFRWFATVTAEVAAHLKVSDEVAFKEVLQSFFYIDEIQRNDLAHLLASLDDDLSAVKSRPRS